MYEQKIAFFNKKILPFGCKIRIKSLPLYPKGLILLLFVNNIPVRVDNLYKEHEYRRIPSRKTQAI